MGDMKSRVHPKRKIKYRVDNWPDYDRALVVRDDVTLWIAADAIDTWTPAPSGSHGAQIDARRCVGVSGGEADSCTNAPNRALSSRRPSSLPRQVQRSLAQQITHHPCRGRQGRYDE